MEIQRVLDTTNAFIYYYKLNFPFVFWNTCSAILTSSFTISRLDL